jgi:hypothetical protein
MKFLYTVLMILAFTYTHGTADSVQSSDQPMSVDDVMKQVEKLIDNATNNTGPMGEADKKADEENAECSEEK